MNHFIIYLLCLLTSCTYNISMVHTSGKADDVIDTTTESSPDVAPVLNIPPILP